MPSKDSSIEISIDAVFQTCLEHKAFIRDVIACQVPSKAGVEGLAHDIFLSLLSGPIPKDPNRARSFLYKAITNDIINFENRKQRYTDCRVLNDGDARREPAQTDPDKRCAEIEQLARLFELITESMCQREAKAIKLRCREGLSSGDNYISVGLKKLREFMARKFGDE